MGREQRIREIAYALWQEEGRPEGEAERHWSRAEAIVEAEEAQANKPGEARTRQSAMRPVG